MKKLLVSLTCICYAGFISSALTESEIVKLAIKFKYKELARSAINAVPIDKQAALKTAYTLPMNFNEAYVAPSGAVVEPKSWGKEDTTTMKFKKLFSAGGVDAFGDQVLGKVVTDKKITLSQANAIRDAVKALPD